MRTKPHFSCGRSGLQLVGRPPDMSTSSHPAGMAQATRAPRLSPPRPRQVEDKGDQGSSPVGGGPTNWFHSLCKAEAGQWPKRPHPVTCLSGARGGSEPPGCEVKDWGDRDQQKQMHSPERFRGGWAVSRVPSCHSPAQPGSAGSTALPLVGGEAGPQIREASGARGNMAQRLWVENPKFLQGGASGEQRSQVPVCRTTGGSPVTMGDSRGALWGCKREVLEVGGRLWRWQGVGVGGQGETEKRNRETWLRWPPVTWWIF